MFIKMGYGVYFFFASLMIISAFFIFFCLPETKGIPLESMDRLFQVKPVRRANDTVMEELRLQDERFRGIPAQQDGQVSDELSEKARAEQKESFA